MSYSGNTLAFQAKARGSIPLIRFLAKPRQPWTLSPSSSSKGFVLTQNLLKSNYSDRQEISKRGTYIPQ